uniref:Uncharacterized protein n=1 Tax=Siphoviridae sp. ctLqe90 TaxID=2825456 RepID=A0A8S5Q1G6_9CAUD|nr:MAG TPA: hypothetical protein [Siphoviridae sp. ctLqe90]
MLINLDIENIPQMKLIILLFIIYLEKFLF